MYELKTKVNDASVVKFLEGYKEEPRYPDLLQLVDLMKEVSGDEPKMWGSSIIGFGTYHYKGKSSGGEWFCIGFSPRKANISIYANSDFEKEKAVMDRLGKYKTGKSCLFINRLEDIDVSVLKEFLEKSMKALKD